MEIEEVYNILLENDLIDCKKILSSRYPADVVNCLLDIKKKEIKYFFMDDIFDVILGNLSLQQIQSLKKISKEWRSNVDRYSKRYFEKLLRSDQVDNDKMVLYRDVCKVITAGNVKLAKHLSDQIAKYAGQISKDFLFFNLARHAMSCSSYMLAEYIIRLSHKASTFDLLTQIAHNHVTSKNFQEAIRITQLLEFPKYYITTILNLIMNDLLDQPQMDLDLALRVIELFDKIDFEIENSRKYRNSHILTLVFKLIRPYRSPKKVPSVKDIEEALRLSSLPGIDDELRRHLLYDVGREAAQYHPPLAFQISHSEFLGDYQRSNILFTIGMKNLTMAESIVEMEEFTDQVMKSTLLLELGKKAIDDNNLQLFQRICDREGQFTDDDWLKLNLHKAINDGNSQQALRSITAISSNQKNSRYFFSIVDKAIDGGNFQMAERISDIIEDPSLRSKILYHIGIKAIEKGNIPLARRISVSPHMSLDHVRRSLLHSIFMKQNGL